MAHFSLPAHTFIGDKALEESISYLSEFGKKPLIVSGPHVGKSPMMEELIKTLKQNDFDYSVYMDISSEPTDEMIEAGYSKYKQDGCDFLIGIGGGSPLDSAKAIAAKAVISGEFFEYMGKEIKGDIPKIVAIPTTAGTGSEATKFTIITDTKRKVKMLLKGDCLVPDVAILNPSFTIDTPVSVTVATGLDALTHAIEAYTSKKASYLTDTYAISAVKRIMTYLPTVIDNGYDLKAREQMSLAAYEAGVCINNSSVTIVHGMSRPIGALFHVPHGLSNAMLLGKCLEFALDGAYERFADLGRAISAADTSDSDENASKKFLSAVNKLLEICEVPTPEKYGIKKDDFLAVVEKMSEDAIASGSPANTQKAVTAEDCRKIYCSLYA